MKRPRMGSTLIELTVVLTVLSLVWLSITCALYTLYRADIRLRDDLQYEQSLDRFAMRLRLDAHAASSAELVERDEGGKELVLSTEGRRSIHYGISDQGVYRVVREGEAILHRDKFLTSRVTSQWELQSPQEHALIVVTLAERDARSQATRVQQIKASVAPAKAMIAGAGEKPS